MNNEKILINDNKSNNSEIKSNNEIEELAKILDKIPCRIEFNDHVLNINLDPGVAEILYEKGYRKQIKSKWVMIPVDGVVRYRCENINCHRLIPFGCSPNELDYCPFCGARMTGEER